VQPAVPFRRNAARVIGAVVDHPAPFAPVTRLLFRAIVAVALRVGADVLAIASAEQRGADRGTIPPGEDLHEDSHGPRTSAKHPARASLPIDLRASGNAQFLRTTRVQFQ